MRVTDYERAFRNCISTNFDGLLRSRLHSAQRYRSKAARVSARLWSTRVLWWTRVWPPGLRSDHVLSWTHP
jgi:hypothetical protein